MSNPYVIGLTGNLGSGKSTVRKMLERLGARGIDADELAHAAAARGSRAWSAIVAAFGADVLRFNGDIDRRSLAARVFSDPAALKQLEAILHPAVGALLKGMLHEATQPVVVIEAIKLVEAGLHTWCDALWVVTCTPEVAVQRVMRDRHMSAEEARVRLAAQGPLDEKLKLANVVIDNSGDEQTTLAQVHRAWEQTVRPGAGRPKAQWLDGPSSLPPAAPVGPSRAEARPSPKAGSAEAERPPKPPSPEPPSFRPEEHIEGDKLAGQETLPHGKGQPTAAKLMEPAEPPKPLEVRRAKRSDLDAIGSILARRDKRSQPLPRAQLLEQFGQRGYRIAVSGDRIVALAAWEAENLVALTREVWTESPEAARRGLPSLFALIEHEASVLQCEVSLILLEPDTPGQITEQVKASGYEQHELSSLLAVWRQVAEQRKPKGRYVWLKRLRAELVTQPV